MSVYIDENYITNKRRTWWHLGADDVQELHLFAQSIGLKPEWFQDKKIPHYDITLSKSILAVANGAILINSKEFIQKCRPHNPKMVNNT